MQDSVSLRDSRLRGNETSTGEVFHEITKQSGAVLPEHLVDRQWHHLARTSHHSPLETTAVLGGHRRWGISLDEEMMIR